MREIKFRGKAKMSIEELNKLSLKHENGWVYGHLVMYGKIPYIVGDFIEVDSEYTVNEFWVEVIPDTIGQFVGLKDKNGKEIYEGDIFKAKHSGIFEYIGHVYHEDCFGFKIMNYPVFGWPEYKNYTFWIKEFIEHFPLEHVEVIGNIYENPDLLEESE